MALLIDLCLAMPTDLNHMQWDAVTVIGELCSGLLTMDRCRERAQCKLTTASLCPRR